MYDALIKSLSVGSSLSSTTLYSFAKNTGSNLITRIDDLGSLVQLKTLDLSKNQISKIENLSKLPSLHHLVLSKSILIQVGTKFVKLKT